LVKQLENDSIVNNFAISYLDKNEAIFALCLLKSVPCSHCPDFYRGCYGGSTLHEIALLSDKEFIDKHIQGTEGFLCGKLRNIISLSKAEEQEISNKFEKQFNNRVSLLTKKNDNDKFVLIHDKDELNNILKNVEQQTFEKLQYDIDKINKHNSSIINELQERITYQDSVIQEMQMTIKKLKKSAKVNES
jgi:hypothetical protein